VTTKHVTKGRAPMYVGYVIFLETYTCNKNYKFYFIFFRVSRILLDNIKLFMVYIKII